MAAVCTWHLDGAVRSAASELVPADAAVDVLRGACRQNDLTARLLRDCGLAVLGLGSGPHLVDRRQRLDRHFALLCEREQGQVTVVSSQGQGLGFGIRFGFGFAVGNGFRFGFGFRSEFESDAYSEPYAPSVSGPNRGDMVDGRIGSVMAV